MEIRPYRTGDLPAMIEIWNQVVEDGMAFPQEDKLDIAAATHFFADQVCSIVAAEDGVLLGLYVLHPNNIGRCGHIANASYAVHRDCRGWGVGEALVRDSLERAKDSGFHLMQFNAVVCSNAAALHLYDKLGFHRLGLLPGGFRDKTDTYQDTILFCYEL